MALPRLRRASLVLVLACSAVLRAQMGTVLRSQKINDVSGGFTGALSDGGYFGWSLAALGDLNGDGVPDLAASAYEDDDGGPDRGAIWILFLDASGRVSTSQKISQTQGGFAGVLPDGADFGRELAAPGDLDGDGRTELVATSARPNQLWVLFLNADGTVRSQRSILFGDPAFQPPTFARNFDNGAMKALGDTDGDGLGDLVLGAPYDDDGPGYDVGALWVLRLNADGSAKSTQKISQTEGGFTGTLETEEYFGEWLGNAGDLDGDGRPEVALGTPGLQVGNPRRYAGGVSVGTFRADGMMSKGVLLSSDRGGLGPLPADTYFGRAVAPLGDLDGDGTTELAVGAPADSDAGPERGAVWILFLKGTAVRNASGVNPLTLSELREPVMRTTWTATLDCSGHAPGLALLLGSDRPLSGVFVPQGEVLVDSHNHPVFRLVAPHTGGAVQFQAAVPNTAAMIDLELFVQGLCTGAPGARLSSALDVVVGL